MPQYEDLDDYVLSADGTPMLLDMMGGHTRPDPRWRWLNGRWNYVPDALPNPAVDEYGCPRREFVTANEYSIDEK